MAKILITFEMEHEVNALRSILMDMQDQAELVFLSREEDVRDCLMTGDVDICFINYEIPNYLFTGVVSIIEDNELPVSTIITAEPQNFSRLREQVEEAQVLLKPLDPDRTRFCIQQIIDRNRILESGEYRPGARDLWFRTKPQLAEIFWKEGLQGQFSRRTIRHRDKSCRAPYSSAISAGIEVSENYLVLPVMVYPRRSGEERYAEYLDVKNAYESIMMSVVIREYGGYAYYISENEQVALFYPYDIRLSANQVAHRCFQFCREIERQLGGSHACIVGEACHLEDLSQQWQGLRQMARQNRFQGDSVHFFGKRREDCCPMTYAPVSRWAELILAGREQAVEMEVRHFFEVNSNNPGLTTDYIVSILYDLDRYVAIASARLELESEDSELGKQVRDQFIVASSSAENFVKWVLLMAQYCADCKRQGSNSGKAIEQAKAYIRSNLNGDLSRSRIAEHVHISQNYLARLFREQVGMTVSDYIMDERIKLAQDFLSKTNLNVMEIADRVGFSSPAYFASCFKKRMGCSPQGFRRGEGPEKQHQISS